MFIAPMLASPIPKKWEFTSGTWVAEEKYDGHRIIVEVGGQQATLFTKQGVTAWSRYGLERKLPTHLLEALSNFPRGIYDGELLVPGKRSYGVTELVNGPDLVYYIFDLLQLVGHDTTDVAYKDRRSLLEKGFEWKEDSPVQLAFSMPVNTWDEVIKIRDAVWARDGEGLILKRIDSRYQIGKRSKDFIKIKALRTAVMTLVGFEPSRGLINDRGPYAMVKLEDEDGTLVTVKTRNDAECRAFEEQARLHDAVLTAKGWGVDDRDNGAARHHPALGRKLRIEYQERTPDGEYRHPRWDRWEDE